MFNILGYTGSANANSTLSMVVINEMNSNKCWQGFWGKRKPYALLEGM
jgi:hypothetical protein